jgi:hypothetical protein
MEELGWHRAQSMAKEPGWKIGSCARRSHARSGYEGYRPDCCKRMLSECRSADLGAVQYVLPVQYHVVPLDRANVFQQRDVDLVIFRLATAHDSRELLFFACH